MFIRNEQSGDRVGVHALIAAAFAGMPYSNQTEVSLLEGLRAAGALSLSLVVIEGNEVVGHIAFSPVAIAEAEGWYGVGPVAVRPDRQRRGIGQALVRAGLERLQGSGAAGCVLVGDPAYYRRFGFRVPSGLVLPGVPPEVFLVLPFGGEVPKGTVRFHEAFEIAASGTISPSDA